MPRSPQPLPAILSATALAGVLTITTSLSHALEPLVKQGTCPSGYYTQGDYCLRSR
ncbi:hypothetical protein [Thiorhodovibrio frisius]|uniref:Uncharacterized protein n=1 Tax=Thiorhodovibrio frisius TaxID=631362 RepID=H8YWL6_9GAMM|nr:hypothetical protein [Thiorhodovibrio frisius]EIC22842.1 hypothetical protein Thi970DRAFT_00478 [Thiorhodovibrio frisius]WPL22901.1 hypothetical protein Thiofri_03079 [Thiorhodovibrio frisius]